MVVVVIHHSLGLDQRETRGRVLEEIRPKDHALTQTHETG